MSDIKAPAQSYDLTLTVGRVGHLIATAAGHGLTLSDDAIAWTSAGKLESRALADITGVHLESAAVINQGMTDLCQVEFADGTKLTVTNLQWGVFAPADSRHTDLLRAFADDLHRRLPDAVKPDLAHGAGSPPAPGIAFSAGFSPARYQLLVSALVLVGIALVALPLWVFLVTGKMPALLGLIPAALMAWPLIKTARKNAPRSYQPRSPPDELMQ